MFILPWVHEKFTVKFTMSYVDGCAIYIHIGCLNCPATVEAGILKVKAVPNVLFVTWKYVNYCHNLQKSHYTLHSEIEWLLCVCFWALPAVVSIVWLCVIAGCEVGMSMYRMMLVMFIPLGLVSAKDEDSL